MSDDPSVVSYVESPNEISAELLTGFFVGWPNPPTPATHLKMLRHSSHVVLALQTDRVVGFINAVSDHTLAAYIPLLEVLPEYQRRGIGRQLVGRMLKKLEGMYMVDLVCDDDVAGFYEHLGLTSARAMIRRNFAAQSGIQD